MSDRLISREANNIIAADGIGDIVVFKRYDGSMFAYSPSGPIPLMLQFFAPTDFAIGSTSLVTVQGLFPLDTKVKLKDDQDVDHFPPVNWGLTTLTFDPIGLLLGDYAISVVSGEQEEISMFNPTFSVIEPLILNSITPNTAEWGPGPVIITLSGSGFYSGCELKIDSSIRSPVTYVSPTELTFDFTPYCNDAGDVGTHNVSVSSNNMGNGSFSEVLPFIVTEPATPDTPAPTLASVSPTLAMVGQATVITLTGTGFLPESKVKAMQSVTWDLVTTFVSATELTATLGPDNVSAGTSVQVWVANPDGDATVGRNVTIA